MPDGDVLACYGMPPVGNIKTTPMREIWSNRPKWWKGGCCLESRLTPAERRAYMEAAQEQGAIPDSANRQMRRQAERMQQQARGIPDVTAE